MYLGVDFFPTLHTLKNWGSNLHTKTVAFSLIVMLRNYLETIEEHEVRSVTLSPKMSHLYAKNRENEASLSKTKES